MIGPRAALGTILFAILVASCGNRPGVTVSIAGQSARTVLASTTERTACSAAHGDMAVGEQPLTTVRAASAPELRFEAGTGVTGIRGWIYDLQGGVPSGGPIEQFDLPGRAVTYVPRSIVVGRTYEVVVNVQWSFVVTNGEETHLFRVRVEPP